MKTEQKLKVALVVLLIILISLISFGGIFVKQTKFVNNILPDYAWGTDFTGSRTLGVSVSTSTNTVIYDKDGNVVEEEGKDTTTKEEPVNPKESLTLENYKEAKRIMTERLERMGITDYTIRFDETNGKMYFNLPENNQTDALAQFIPIKGEFKIIDLETEEELLNENHLEKAYWSYNTTEAGTTVFLVMQFNEEGKEKLKDITNTYVSYEENGETKTKKVSFMVDNSSLIDTYFDEEISNGMIQLSIGTVSSTGENFSNYAEQAARLAILLDVGSLPLTYTIGENRYEVSDITPSTLFIPILVAISLIVIGIIFLSVRYRKNGLLASFSYIGYIAFYLLIIRSTHTVISLESIVGIVIAVILNYIFTMYLLHLLKHEEANSIEEASNSFKEAILKSLVILIPVIIISVILCFASLVSISSFGMTIFWGILISFLYNLVITRSLIVLTTKK